MGRGGLKSETAAVVATCMMCCLFVGLVAQADFRCYDCASLLSPESSCETGPDFNSSTKCTTFCYTDVITQAGVRSYMKRGCTTEPECTPESSCRELSRTGPCRSCCQAHLCNDDAPDIWAPQSGAGDLGVARGCGLAMMGGVIVQFVMFAQNPYY